MKLRYLTVGILGLLIFVFIWHRSQSLSVSQTEFSSFSPPTQPAKMPDSRPNAQTQQPMVKPLALATPSSVQAPTKSQNRRPAFRGGTVSLQVRHQVQDLASSFHSGRQMQIESSNYEILNLRAIPSADYNSGQGDVVLEKFGYVFVKSDDASIPQMLITDSRPVVAKSSNGMIALVTGTLIVKLKDASAAQMLAQSYGLELKSYDADVMTAYYKVPSGSSVVSATQILAQNSSVSVVQPEIVQAIKGF